MTTEMDPIAVDLPDYAICTPYWGAVDIEHDDCKRWLRGALPTLKHYRVTACAYIDLARAALVRMVEMNGHRGLVFIDHDILFQPGDVAALIRSAEANQAVVSGAYCMRKSGDKIIAGFHEMYRRATFFEGGDLYAGAWSGLGFTAIPWAVIERVVKHFDMPRLHTPIPDIDGVWPLFALDVSGTWYNGEDISFVQRLKAAGESLLIDTRARLVHKGSYSYGIEDAQVIVPRAKTLYVDLKPKQPAPKAAAGEQFEGLDAGVDPVVLEEQTRSERYTAAKMEWLEARRRAGGVLPQEEEARFADQCDRIWVTLTPAECQRLADAARSPVHADAIVDPDSCDCRWCVGARAGFDLPREEQASPGP